MLSGSGIYGTPDSCKLPQTNWARVCEILHERGSKLGFYIPFEWRLHILKFFDKPYPAAFMMNWLEQIWVQNFG